MKKLDGIAQNWNFTRDFPEISADFIERPHFLETILEILSSENRIVFLEGKEGEGATTTLAQICLTYPTNTFSLFIKPASRFAYSPDYLRLVLAEQIYWYVNGTSLNRSTFDISEFESLIIKMRGVDRKKILYFVVDGLHQIPTEDHRYVSQIFSSVLPLGVDNCRFIIVGQQELFLPLIKGSMKSKTYQQLKFRPEESRQFLSKSGLDEKDCNIVHQMCKGIPGRLAMVNRLLSSGSTLESIITADPSKYLEFIKLEFAPVEEMSENHRLILATVAFSKMPMSAIELSEVLALPMKEVNLALHNSQLLTVNSTSGCVEYASVSHQKYAEKQLDRLRKKSDAAQVAYLLKNPRSGASLRFLPNYYETLAQHDAVLDLLSKEHYIDLLENTQSFSALQQRAEMGARNAISLRKTEEVFKFSLQKSIFNSAGNLETSENQIEALVALGKSNSALILANCAAAKIDRLALLASYARKVKERLNTIDPELIAVIRSLTSEIDFSELGDKAIGIASNILILEPDVAIGIIESASKGAADGFKDAAYVELSFTASASKINHRTKIDDKAIPKISDAVLQQLAMSFEALADNLSTHDILEKISKMPVAHQMQLLRAHIKVRKEDANILDIIEYGLGAMVSEAEYKPKVVDLMEFASPFVHPIKDLARLAKLLDRFDSQMGLVANTAQSKDLILLQMNLAAAEAQFSAERARDRVEQTYYDVFEIRTPEVQLECYGLMLSSLNKLDTTNKLEERDGFRSIIRIELAKLVDDILSNTADHLTSVSAVLKVLASDDIAAASELAGKLNTQDRRNQAYGLVAGTIVSQPYTESRIISLRSILKKITCPKDRSDAAISLIGFLDANKERNTWLNFLPEFGSLVLPPRDQGRWAVWLIRRTIKFGGEVSIDEFNTLIERIISTMDSSLEAVDLYFQAAAVTGAVDPVTAGKFYNAGQILKAQSTFNTKPSAKILVLCLSLIARSFTAVAQASMISEDLLKRFYCLIEELPSELMKVEAYTDFAERLWCVKREDLAFKIINEQLSKLLESIKKIHLTTYQEAVAIVFPVYSVQRQRTALDMLECVTVDVYDSSLQGAANLTLRRLPGSAPEFNGKIDHTKLEANDVLDIIELISCTKTDAVLYFILKDLVNVVRHKENKTKFTGAQKADWASRCRGIIDMKLPDPNNIKHPGFKVACLALTYSLDDSHFSKWESLVTLTESISNIADRGYVYLTLAASLPARFHMHRKNYLEQALELAQKIPSPIDRMSHLESYAREACNSDASASAKEALKQAMKLSLELESNAKASQHRREMIDIADLIDSSFADELVALVDDDPARMHLKSETKRLAAVSKSKRELANAKKVSDAASCDIKILPAAAWKNLSALEAGRLEVKSVDVMTEFVSKAANGTLNDAFPVLSWYLENLGRKYRLQKDIGIHLLPISEALLLSTEIAQAVVKQVAARGISEQLSEELDTGIVVGRQDRNAAVVFIEEWLRENASEYITYCDAYFSPKDIDLLRIFLAQAPSCRVNVLASKSHLLNCHALSDDVFMEAWREKSDQSPPETEIIALSYSDSSKHVVHDRWLLTKRGGLRFGTSFNSLGDGKLSEVSEIDLGQLPGIRQRIELFMNRQRTIDGARIQYNSFTLY